MNNEENTSFVISAKIIATNGGTRDQKVPCIFGTYSLPPSAKAISGVSVINKATTAPKMYLVLFLSILSSLTTSKNKIS
jgi:hypothetical protein